LRDSIERGRIPSAGHVDDVEHDLHIKTRLRAHHQRLERRDGVGRGERVVDQLHGLAHARARADIEDVEAERTKHDSTISKA